jgi:hypothetical protein
MKVLFCDVVQAHALTFCSIMKWSEIARFQTKQSVS